MNITLAAEKKLIDKARKYAQDHNTTLNKLVRDYLKELVDKEGGGMAAERFLRVCDRIAGDSGRWTWNRSELYENG